MLYSIVLLSWLQIHVGVLFSSLLGFTGVNVNSSPHHVSLQLPKIPHPSSLFYVTNPSTNHHNSKLMTEMGSCIPSGPRMPHSKHQCEQVAYLPDPLSYFLIDSCVSP